MAERDYTNRQQNNRAVTELVSKYPCNDHAIHQVDMGQLERDLHHLMDEIVEGVLRHVYDKVEGGDN
jgi:hypothetical protein